ncbi:MAG: HEPN domain-containing protein [Deltaproteobacteria bacterium]|nr:HEPN domain-containing protein [Deltaproteobacteria bacterium]
MSQQIIIDYWVEKAGEDLASARDNLKSSRYQNAVRDAYFACFHAFSSVLLNEGKTFKKHKEVRWHKADYRPLIQFDADQVKEIVEESEAFVKEMAALLNRLIENGKNA